MNNINKQKGLVKVSLETTVLWAVLILVFLGLTILFSTTMINNIKETNLSSNLLSVSNTIVKQVNENFKAINEKVFSSIEKNIKHDDFIESIRKDLPSALRIIVVDKKLEKIILSSFPEINYATLDMLKNTKKSNKNPVAEIHLFGQKDQYINYIHILDNEKSKYLVISLPAKEILVGLNDQQVGKGNIILNQTAGKFSLVTMKSWGKTLTEENLITAELKVPNSLFSVKYSYKPDSYFLRGTGVIPALIGVVISLLLLIVVVISILKKLKKIKFEVNTQGKRIYIPASQKVESLVEKELEQGDIKSGISSGKEDNIIKSKVDKSIFRAYDIRGIVDESLTVDTVRLIGQAIGTENIKRGKKDIVVARDGRLSGKILLKALVEGLNNSGCNVVNIGDVPTGVLYFATHHLETGSGVMLTGSHNPANYNGLKIMLNGETLAGELIQDLYNAIINDELDEGEGTEQQMDIVDDYVDYIASDIQLDSELKIVVDSGNGIGGVIGPQVLEEIGCEVIPLHCEVDGSFPNHHPDPSVPENLVDLISVVKETGADLGIAFDGDADRLGVVTKEGEIIYSDRVLMLYAKDVLSRQPGASIIFDVKCTGHLPKEIVKYGGLPIIWKTGHSFMKAKLQETKAALAGEMSGHFFFNERWFGFDDGIYAAARLLEIIDQENRPASEIFAELPDSVSTPELKCHTKEGENYAFMAKFQKVASFPDANLTTIDGIRADFSDGWGLVRCSNTTPCLVLRFDADNQEALDRIKEEFRAQILAVDKTLKLPF